VLRFLLLTLLFVFIARAFWQVVGGVMEAVRGAESRRDGRAPPAVKLVRDPVCGTFVPPRAALSATASGSTHYFCSEECRQKFGRGQGLWSEP
jgi:YHS domain-containing protein